jgi:hypothetical protein
LAKESLGEATAAELAAYIRQTFGLAIQPPFVAVLLGTLQERAVMERSRQTAYEKIERWKAENPAEAKKVAAAAKRREAARQRKAESQQPQPEAPPEAPRGKAEADLPGL